jgi:hypothetical protein
MRADRNRAAEIAVRTALSAGGASSGSLEALVLSAAAVVGLAPAVLLVKADAASIVWYKWASHSDDLRSVAGHGRLHRGACGAGPSSSACSAVKATGRGIPAGLARSVAPGPQLGRRGPLIVVGSRFSRRLPGAVHMSSLAIEQLELDRASLRSNSSAPDC